MLRGAMPAACAAAAKVRRCACSTAVHPAIARRSQNAASAVRSRRYAATVWPLMRRSFLRCKPKRSIHSRSAGVTGPPSPLSSRQRKREQLADAQKKLGTHSRMEMRRIVRADREHPQGALRAPSYRRGYQQGYQRHGADCDAILAEEKIALSVADLSASRFARLQQRLERLHLRSARVRISQESVRLERARGLEEQEQHRVARVEVLAQARLRRADRLGQGASAEQALREAVYALGERVVGARDLHQFLQLTLERLIALAQYLHLALDQADRCAGVAHVRQPQLSEQRSVTLEEIRIGRKIIRDARVVDRVVFDTARLTRGHCSFLPMLSHWMSIIPLNTVTAGPVSHTGLPGPGQATCALPPGKSTRTSGSSSPCLRPTTT